MEAYSRCPLVICLLLLFGVWEKVREWFVSEEERESGREKKETVRALLCLSPRVPCDVSHPAVPCCDMRYCHFGIENVVSGLRSVRILVDRDPKPTRALSTTCMGAKPNCIPCQINCLTALFQLLSHSAEHTSDACGETWREKTRNAQLRSTSTIDTFQLVN